TLAQHHRIDAQSEMLDKMFAMRDEDFLDQIGMRHQINAAMREAQLDDIAVLAGAARKKIEPTAAEVRQIAGEPMPLRSGRHAWLSHDPSSPRMSAAFPGGYAMRIS